MGGSVAIEEFVGLQRKMCLFLVSSSSEYKKAKGIGKNAVAKLIYNECKDVLLIKKWIYAVYNNVWKSW